MTDPLAPLSDYSPGDRFPRLEWRKDPYAPIPDYHCTAGRFRIYRHAREDWKLQDNTSPDHPEPVLNTFSFADAKQAAEQRRKA